MRAPTARRGRGGDSMKRRRHTPEQIVRKLREADRLLAEGADVALVCRPLEVSVQTYQRWRVQYKAMRPEDVARLKKLEKENARLKRLRGGAGARHRHAAGGGPGKLLTPERRRRAVGHLQAASGSPSGGPAARQASTAHRSDASQGGSRRALFGSNSSVGHASSPLRLPAIHVLLMREGWRVTASECTAVA